MSSPFQRLQDWLTLDEAASELSKAASEHVSAADVLRLVLDEHLKLSLYLPVKVGAKCKRVDDPALDPDWTHKGIEGLWPVPIYGKGKRQLEHDYQFAKNRNYVPRPQPEGALVEKDGWVCQLPPDRGTTGMWSRTASEFPEGSVLAIARGDLDAFVASHVHAAEPTPADGKPVDATASNPLGERERGSLLTIIAALAKAAQIDISRPSKAAEAIENLTTQLGARVSARTIENHLKRIPDALERKAE